MSIDLQTARPIVGEALSAARAEGLKPLTVVVLDAGGHLTWSDGRAQGPLRGEPETTLTRRVLARVLGWLPIEPYL